MRKFFRKSLMLVAAVTALTSCSDDDKVVVVPAPAIVQSEQIAENPITLAFSWTGSEEVVSYNYALTTQADGKDTTLVTGTTNTTSVEIAASKTVDLAFDTEYTFNVVAVSAEAMSETATVKVKTSAAPFKLEITNLSYRGATFSIVPSDPNMLYQAAQTEWSNYSRYATDEAFIEGYDYGYYQTMARPPIPWYGWMEMGSQKGNYTWTTRILSPTTDYIFYTYGCRFDYKETPDAPVAVLTPLVKMKFTTPEWKATSNTTFDVTSVSQTVGEGGKVVSTVKVMPSDNTEKYLVTFVEDDYLTANYGGSAFRLLMGRMGDLEIQRIVKDYNWTASGLLHTGEAVITNTSTGITPDANISAGKKYYALVIGVSDDGLQTTEIKSLALTAPAE